MLVTFLPVNRKIEAKAGSNLFYLARENGIDLGGICSGNKTCGKCKVLITKGNLKEYTGEEMIFLTEEERDKGTRLACCFEITEDTCVILMDKKLKKDPLYPYENPEDGKGKKGSEHKAYCEKAEDMESAVKGGNNDTDSPGYGVAVDLGTTSVVVQLFNLRTGKSIGQLGALNPQSSYGADVISRITYAMGSADNRTKLTSLIRDCCNSLIRDLAACHNINRIDIKYIVAAGNTTMSHLFLGRPVDSLSKVPFYGISYKGEEHKPSDLGIDIGQDGRLYIMPGIGGHVGSDTLGCIIAANLSDTSENILLVDIGTNGEIVLSRKGKLTVCSTAAGPAFEGASLFQGMRAVNGAVTTVDIDKGKVSIDYIGSETPGIKPAGICGSGIIEAVSELYKNGMMDATGRLSGEAGIKNYVALWNEGDKEIRVTQKDIRELQLAKGAIFAGIKLLLKEEGIRMENVDKIYLAGAFGTNLNLEKAVHIGLLPRISPDRYEYIGNGALSGAAKILLGETKREEAELISIGAKHLELALCEDFQEEFMNALSLPGE